MVKDKEHTHAPDLFTESVPAERTLKFSFLDSFLCGAQFFGSVRVPSEIVFEK